MTEISPKTILDRYRHARDRRSHWESHWQECYDYALPIRDGADRNLTPGAKRNERIYDGTAPDAVDQLAASLLGNLTPPWGRWFALQFGPDVDEEQRSQAAKTLEDAAAMIRSHFDRSNFAVEIHQCYLDLVTAGTACLLFEEASPGAPSAFRFSAVPLTESVLAQGPEGRLDTTFRRRELTAAEFRHAFPKAEIPREFEDRSKNDPDARMGVVEAVVPDNGAYSYLAVREDGTDRSGDPETLSSGRMGASPFINFRWMKVPGESYGRSPVMKTLPDIKTANKVVELVLKNASIAVTGIWQADDDGVLNPATIKLQPGTIIPKAVGSAGLTPLEAPGKFDVSQLVLDDLRGRIRTALLADKLGAIQGPKMTATEVLERAADMARLMGATYGRLQSELLLPLIRQAARILARRGEIPPLPLDGRIVEVQFTAPLARAQSTSEAQGLLHWLQALGSAGPEALAIVDPPAAARWLSKAYGVPPELLREVPPPMPGGVPGGAPGEDPAAALAAAAPAPTAAPSGQAGMPDLGALAGIIQQAMPNAGGGNG